MISAKQGVDEIQKLRVNQIYMSEEKRANYEWT